jgi:hypothetical protein
LLVLAFRARVSLRLLQEEPLPISFDTGALGISVGVFGLAILVAWVLKRFQITDSVGFLVVVLLPFATYGIVSGYVAKIALPGGWAIEFRQIAAAKVQPTDLIAEAQNIDVIAKGGAGDIPAIRDGLVAGRPLAVSLQLGRRGYYQPEVISQYVRAFMAFDPDLTVIFVDDQGGSFVASASGQSVLAVVDGQETASRFVNAIEFGNIDELAALVLLTTGRVTAETTNTQALQMMQDDGVDALIQVDVAGLPTGVVRRSVIVGKLMLTLAAAK